MENYPFTQTDVDETVNKLFTDSVVNLSQVDNPQGYVIGGLTGAGKSTLLKNIQENLDRNLFIVNGDEYRKFHPLYTQIIKDHGEDYPKYTNEFSTQVSEALLRKAAASKYNLAIEGTFRTSEAPIAILNGLKAAGYEAQVVIKAEHPEIAWQNTLDRAEKERQLEGIGRVVSREHFDLVNQNLLPNADKIYQSQLASKTTIIYQDQVVFDSSLLRGEDKLPSQVISEIYHQENKTHQPNENAFVFNDVDMTSDRYDLNALAQEVTHNYDHTEKRTNYYFRQVHAFSDYGDAIRMATPEASKNDEMILIALQTAILHHKSGFTIVGSDEFKQQALKLIAEYDLKPVLLDETQRAAVDTLKQSVAERAKVIPEKNLSKSDMVKESEVQPDAPNADVLSQGKVPEPKDNPLYRGELIETGRAPYKFKEGEKESPYIVLKTDDQTTPNKTLWGVDFPRAIAEAGTKVGDVVTVEHLGNQPITVKVPLRDQDTNKITGFKNIQTIRNAWKIDPVYSKPTQNNPDAIKPADFKGYDLKSIKETHEKLTEVIINNTPEGQPVPKINNGFDSYQGDYVYFYPNGKPVPHDVTKPLTPPDVPEETDQTNTVLFYDKNSPVLSAVMVGAKAGYFQGLIKNPENNEYHPMIAPINQVTDNESQLSRHYVTMVTCQQNELKLIGYGNVDVTGENIKYKSTLYNNEVKTMHPTDKELKFKPAFKGFFDNAKVVYEYEQRQAMKQQQEVSHNDKPTQKPKP